MGIRGTLAWNVAAAARRIQAPGVGDSAGLSDQYLVPTRWSKDVEEIENDTDSVAILLMGVENNPKISE